MTVLCCYKFREDAPGLVVGLGDGSMSWAALSLRLETSSSLFVPYAADRDRVSAIGVCVESL